VVEAELVTLPTPSLKMMSLLVFFQQAIPATVARDVTPPTVPFFAQANVEEDSNSHNSVHGSGGSRVRDIDHDTA